MKNKKDSPAPCDLLEKLALEAVTAEEFKPEHAALFAGMLEEIAAAGREQGKDALALSAEILAGRLKGDDVPPGGEFPDVLSRGIEIMRLALDGELDNERAETETNALFSQTPAPAETLAESQKKEMAEFAGRLGEGVDEMEAGVLNLKKDKDNSETLSSILRLLHTVKGEAGMIGMANLGKLAHGLEGFMQKIRSGETCFDEDAESTVLRALDVFRDAAALIPDDPDGALARDVSGPEEELTAVSSRGAPADGGGSPADSEQRFTPSVPKIDVGESGEILLEFINESRDEHLECAERSLLNLESSPGGREDIDNLFRAFHTIKGMAGFMALEDIGILAHETETVMDLVRNNLLEMSDAVGEAVLRSIDGMRRFLSLLGEQVRGGGVLKSPYYDAGPVIETLRKIVSGAGSPIQPGAGARLGQIMVDQTVVTEDEVDGAVERQMLAETPKRIGEALVEGGAATLSQVERALDIQRQGHGAEDSLRISLAKLDALVETAGELAINGSLVSENPLVKGAEGKITRDMAQLGQNIREIQNIAMSLRLVPIRPVFRKMVRLVRDLSKKAGKKVDLRLSGEDTELDKKIIELIGDPIMHMVRNSVDHGIEAEDVRVSAGKPPAGTLSLSAGHKGGNIIIELEDDGRGLDRGKIIKKARERGLIAEDEAPDEARAYNLIFEPGFSTADTITNVSGRGVGMDVVKRNIEQMRGSIDVHSRPGEGTRITVRLPLTMAVIEGIVLAVGEERYIAPIYSVEEFIQPRDGDISTVEGRGEMIANHGKYYPLVRLNELFSVRSERGGTGGQTGCIIDSDNGTVCLMVDEVLGQHQVVLKNLGAGLEKVKGVSGGAILGNGRVGLILDMNGIAAIAHERS